MKHDMTEEPDMNSRKDFVINININWRILVVFGVVCCILVGAYSIGRAQDGGSPDINVQSAPLDNPSVSNPDIQTAPEAIQCSDGFIPTINGECIAVSDIGVSSGSSTGGSAILGGAGQRHFYLTSTNYYTNQVLTACAVGYHMGSLWEFLDVSNMIYDSHHPAAFNKADSGYGPPSDWNGWVRTGYDSSGSTTPGTGNCNTWSTTSSGVSGVAVKLSSSWEAAPGDIYTWNASSFTCNFTGPVWCVGD